MEKVTEYTIVSSLNLATAIEKVNQKIAEGWQPFGAVATCTVKQQGASMEDKHSVISYDQAMVK